MPSRELTCTYGSVTHVFATAFRYARGFAARLERPLDKDIMKTAIGAAEYFQRQLKIPPEAMPWFRPGRV